MAICYSLRKSHKLLKTDEFSSVFNFRRRLCGQFLAIHYAYNNFGHSRLGMVVSKKVAPKAVSRNYMRRVLRECFRLQQYEIGSLDLIVRVQREFNQDHFVMIRDEFDHLLAKVPKRPMKAKLVV